MRRVAALTGLLLGATMFASGVGAFDLRYGTKGLPVSYGNPYVASGSPSVYTWSAMFDGLAAMDVNGEIEPALALSWELVNPTTWRFHLRHNVEFSNGEPFTADAVVTTIAWLKTSDGARTVIGAEVRNVTGARKEDDHTVLITTNRPDAILPRRMTGVPIIAAKAWTEMGPEEYSHAPATTGSFMIKDWSGNTGRLILAAFPKSWRPPKAARLILVNMPDNPARVQALLSNQIDIAGNVGFDDIDTIEAAGGVVFSATGWSVQALAFRTEPDRKTPVRDVRFRQALNYAIDKKAIVDTLFRGRVRVASQPAGVGTTGHDPTVEPYPYDPAKARALLAEAGYGNGVTLTFAVMIDRTPGDAAIYQTVARQLADVGVKLNLRQVTLPTWMQNYLAGKWPDDIDGFVLGWNAAPYNDVARPMEIYSCLSPSPVPIFCDRGMSNRLAAASEELDSAKREARLKALGREYRDAAPAIFLTETLDLFGVSQKVQGFEVRNRAPAYHKITLK